ncbi:MAG: hypothetical protein QNK77_10420 [Crocinitomicaceae bacterium]
MTIKPAIIVSFLFLMQLFFSSSSFGQNEHMNNWHFGDGEGLDFSGGSPVAVNGLAISTSEGSASVSDAYGNTEFYTDGISVWDASNAIMPNGSGLLGDPSASQSGVAVPNPANPNQYYLLSVDNVSGPNGVTYSIIDMTLAGNGSVASPLGDVTATKNVLLEAQVVGGNNICEKIGVVRHCNGTDFWIVLERLAAGSSRFYVYQLSSTGFALVSSNSGYGTNTTDEVGYLKFSQDGRWMGNTNYYGSSGTQVHSFDSSLGTITHAFDANSNSNFDTPYGLEFSANSQYLFIANYDAGIVMQCDLAVGSSALFESTASLVIDHTDYIGAMQLGPDNNIYAAEAYDAENGIMQISSTNIFGGAFATADFITMGSGDVKDGLPTFYTNTKAPIISPGVVFLPGFPDCPDTLFVNHDYTSYQWYHEGIPIGGEVDTFLVVNQVVGNYFVEVIYNEVCKNTSNTILEVCVSLPVELYGFGVESCGDFACLNWTTISEKDNDYFEIQKSVNGSEWFSIGRVEGAGTTLIEMDYEFIDREVFVGNSYYRLKQIDFDGNFTFSESKSLFTKGEMIRLMAMDQKINLVFPELWEGEIAVFSVLGSMISSSDYSSKSQIYFELNTEALRLGRYWIKCVSKNGKVDVLSFTK